MIYIYIYKSLLRSGNRRSRDRAVLSPLVGIEPEPISGKAVLPITGLRTARSPGYYLETAQSVLTSQTSGRDRAVRSPGIDMYRWQVSVYVYVCMYTYIYIYM